jgi:hypothetical protein
MAVNEITFWACTVKQHKISKVKKALAKLAYYVTEYTPCSVDMTDENRLQCEVGAWAE